LPAAERYESPHRQLRRLAEDARREGLDFTEFWDQVIRPDRPLVTRHRPDPPTDCVIWPRDTFDRQNARKAIMETREAWRRAYEGETPTRGDLALQALGPALNGLTPEAGLRSDREPAYA
jgi:hypothetical protein